MSDLRQRLEDATAEAFARYWTDPPPEFMSDVDDASLAVFASWLRERAEEHRELAQQRPIGSTTLRAQRTATVRRQLLLALASEIDPEENHAE